MGIAKKGVFFTLMSAIIVLLVTLMVTIPITDRLKTKTVYVSKRVHSMNDFMQDIKQDLERALYIIGFRSIFGLEQQIIRNGSYVDSIEVRFKQVILNGTYNNSPVDVMKNSTFLNWTTKIREKALEIGIVVEFNVNDIQLYHINPWEVEIYMNISINLTDTVETASWYQEKSLTADIDIDGFEDPLYVLNSYGRVTSTITRSNFSYFVNKSTNDTTNLRAFINGSYYINSSSAPSFLMRLEGNLSSSGYGIESLVNLNEFLIQEVPILERSAVDWMYFSNQTHAPVSIKNVTDQSGFNWFRLHNASLGRYECEELAQ